MKSPKVFLCHTKPNLELIERHFVPILHEMKTSYFLINWGNMSPDEYEDRILQRIREAKVFVVCISREALTSMWVKKEVDVALVRKNVMNIFCLELDSTDPQKLNPALSDVPRAEILDTQRIRELMH